MEGGALLDDSFAVFFAFLIISERVCSNSSSDSTKSIEIGSLGFFEVPMPEMILAEGRVGFVNLLEVFGLEELRISVSSGRIVCNGSREGDSGRFRFSSGLGGRMTTRNWCSFVNMYALG